MESGANFEKIARLGSTPLASWTGRGYIYRQEIECCGEDAMPSLSQYMAQYEHEHTNPWNKVMHAVGIPISIAGIVLLCITWWRIGLALFVGGWILLFAGHRIEGNKPAFFQGVIYFLVGPLWITKELKDALFGAPHRSTPAH